MDGRDDSVIAVQDEIPAEVHPFGQPVLADMSLKLALIMSGLATAEAFAGEDFAGLVLPRPRLVVAAGPEPSEQIGKRDAFAH